MEEKDIQAFYLLKNQLGLTYAAAFPGASQDIRSLSGQELARFQDHLMETVQGRVSEKWFYTHIKPTRNSKLPRVDVLNLLSAYVGHQDWLEFRSSVADQLPEVTQEAELEPAPPMRGGRKPLVIGLIAVGVLAIAALSGITLQQESRKICFTDAVLGTPIADSGLHVVQLIEGESPRVLVPDEAGCVTITGRTELLRLAIDLPYYQADTLIRSWKEVQEEEIFALRPDDLAHMLRYFASWATQDRLQRSSQLKTMMSPALKVVRMSEDGVHGVEMYNREEFIRFLLIFGQKHLEVLETTYEDGLLTYLRFLVRQ